MCTRLLSPFGAQQALLASALYPYMFHKCVSQTVLFKSGSQVPPPDLELQPGGPALPHSRCFQDVLADQQLPSCNELTAPKLAYESL